MIRFTLRAPFFHLEAQPEPSSSWYQTTHSPRPALLVDVDVTGGHDDVPKLRVLTRVSGLT